MKRAKVCNPDAYLLTQQLYSASVCKYIYIVYVEVSYIMV